MSPTSNSDKQNNNHSISDSGQMKNNADILSEIIGNQQQRTEVAPSLPPFPNGQLDYNYNQNTMLNQPFPSMNNNPYFGVNSFNNGSMYGQNPYFNMNPYQDGFNSIQSLFQTVSTIASMFSQGYILLQTSHRSISNEAHNLSKLKTTISENVSARYIINTIKKFIKRVLRFLYIIPRSNNVHEDIWLQSSQVFKDNSLFKSLWNISIWIVGPLYVWKLINMLFNNLRVKKKADWKRDNSECFKATGKYNFNASSEKQLSFKKGQQIIIAPKDYQTHINGWLLASTDDINEGLIPADYVNIRAN